MSVVYPEEYTDEDKAIYDDLISRGKLMIGTKVKKVDEFLLDLAAKMTINNLKGYKSDKTGEEILEQMKQHKDAMLDNDIITPEYMYNEGQHPLELNPVQTNPEPPYSEESPAASNEKHPLDCNLIQ